MSCIARCWATGNWEATANLRYAAQSVNRGHVKTEPRLDQAVTTRKGTACRIGRNSIVGRAKHGRCDAGYGCVLSAISKMGNHTFVYLKPAPDASTLLHCLIASGASLPSVVTAWLQRALPLLLLQPRPACAAAREHKYLT